MEKFIYIIKSVSTLNGQNKRVDNLWAVDSEEQAKIDIEEFYKEAKNKKPEIENYKVWYIYEKIILVENI